MINIKSLRYFYFGNSLDNIIKVNLLKYKYISYVFMWNNDRQKAFEIKKYCKKNNIKFYISNNVNFAKNIKADGIHISRFDRNTNYINREKFDVIGTTHNQLDYYFKKQQGCKSLFISPIFKTKKYSENKVLGTIKFNLLSKDWNKPVYALGGISKKNIIKIINTNAVGIGGVNYIESLK